MALSGSGSHRMLGSVARSRACRSGARRCLRGSSRDDRGRWTAHACRIALHVNSIAALQVRTAAWQGEWWWETRARKFMSSGSNKAKARPFCFLNYSMMVVWWLFPPCFVPFDTIFRISLRDRTLALRTDESSPSPG